MANEAQDEAASLYISVLASMVIAQMRCTMALLIAMIMEESRRRRSIQQSLKWTNRLLQNFATLPQRSRRKVWMKIRSKDWWERVVMTEYDDEDWKTNFRMTRRSFNKLCGIMEGVMKPEVVTVRAPILLEMRVAIVLYKLASCAEYRVVAKHFGVHKFLR